MSYGIATSLQPARANTDKYLSGGKVRAQQPLASNLQLNPEQSVLDCDAGSSPAVSQTCRGACEVTDTLRVNVGKPLFAQLLLDLFGNVGGGHLIDFSKTSTLDLF